MKTLLASLVLLTPVVAQAAPATAAKPMAVCVAKGTGVVTARPKCKAGESPLSLATVAATTVGPQGPQGPAGPQGNTGNPGPQGPAGFLNTSLCYVKKDDYQLSESGYAFSSVSCNDEKTEFMLSDSMEYQPYVSIAISDRILTILPGDTVPTGVDLSTVSPAKNTYQLKAVIVCCKR